MNLLDERSLAETVDRVSEAFDFARKIPRSDLRTVTRWLALRQGAPQ